MKTLYISDLDGTLLHPNIALSNKSITIINELVERGMIFSVATARTVVSVKSILKDIKINIPIVLMNGVCIYDLGKDDYVKVETFTKESIDMLMSVIKKYRLKGFAYTIKDGIMSTYYEDLHTKALRDFYQERVDRYQKQFIQIDDFASLSNEPLMYFCLIDHKENLEPVFHTIEEIPDFNCVFYKCTYSPDLWYLEICSKSASKYHAVQFLREYMSFEHVVCFGDNHNDIPLFEASDYRIAVENAVPELKELADLVIGNNYDDGVATWLKQNYTNLR